MLEFVPIINNGRLAKLLLSSLLFAWSFTLVEIGIQTRTSTNVPVIYILTPDLIATNTKQTQRAATVAMCHVSSFASEGRRRISALVFCGQARCYLLWRFDVDK